MKQHSSSVSSRSSARQATTSQLTRQRTMQDWLRLKMIINSITIHHCHHSLPLITLPMPSSNHLRDERLSASQDESHYYMELEPHEATPDYSRCFDPTTSNNICATDDKHKDNKHKTEEICDITDHHRLTTITTNLSNTNEGGNELICKFRETGKLLRQISDEFSNQRILGRTEQRRRNIFEWIMNFILPM